MAAETSYDMLPLLFLEFTHANCAPQARKRSIGPRSSTESGTPATHLSLKLNPHVRVYKYNACGSRQFATSHKGRASKGDVNPVSAIPFPHSWNFERTTHLESGSFSCFTKAGRYLRRPAVIRPDCGSSVMNSNGNGSSTGQDLGWTCTPGIVTLNGSFSMLNLDNQSTYFANATGMTVINACIDKLTTQNFNSSSTLVVGSPKMSAPFWSTITPLIFAIATSVTLSYVFLCITFMAQSRRPWLQRLAALSAVVSLTLAADLMWTELERQHNTAASYDATLVRNVRANTALKVIRPGPNRLLALTLD